MGRKRYRVCVLLAVLGGLLGCADSRPFDYTPTSEIRPGPGLFTGEKGAFYLYGDRKTASQPAPANDSPPRGEK